MDANEYPEPTWGSVMARQMREICNSLTPEECQRYYNEAMVIIHGGHPSGLDQEAREVLEWLVKPHRPEDFFDRFSESIYAQAKTVLSRYPKKE